MTLTLSLSSITHHSLPHLSWLRTAQKHLLFLSLKPSSPDLSPGLPLISFRVCTNATISGSLWQPCLKLWTIPSFCDFLSSHPHCDFLFSITLSIFKYTNFSILFIVSHSSPEYQLPRGQGFLSILMADLPNAFKAVSASYRVDDQ